MDRLARAHAAVLQMQHGSVGVVCLLLLFLLLLLLFWIIISQRQLVRGKEVGIEKNTGYHNPPSCLVFEVSAWLLWLLHCRFPPRLLLQHSSTFHVGVTTWNSYHGWTNSRNSRTPLGPRVGSLPSKNGTPLDKRNDARCIRHHKHQRQACVEGKVAIVLAG